MKGLSVELLQLLSTVRVTKVPDSGHDEIKLQLRVAKVRDSGQDEIKMTLRESCGWLSDGRRSKNLPVRFKNAGARHAVNGLSEQII